MIWKPECSQGVEPSRIWAFWITTKKKLSLEACYKYDSICWIYIENVKRKQKLRWDSYELQNCRQMCSCPVLYLLLTSLCLTQPSNPPLLPRPLERNSWRFLRHAWYLTVEEDRKELSLQWWKSRVNIVQLAGWTREKRAVYSLSFASHAPKEKVFTWWSHG